MQTFILQLIDERSRQDAKWGFPQPAMSTPESALAILAEEFGECAREVVEMGCAFREGKQHHFNMHRKNLKKELIQTAAVAIAWLQQMEHEDE